MSEPPAEERELTVSESVLSEDELVFITRLKMGGKKSLGDDPDWPELVALVLKFHERGGCWVIENWLTVG